jgi:hypothetical protein
LRASTSSSRFSKQVIDSGAMAANNRFERSYVVWVALGRQVGTFEQLIGYSLKGRDHDNERLTSRLPDDNVGHAAYASGCCE